jgi:hypothetical protein
MILKESVGDLDSTRAMAGLTAMAFLFHLMHHTLHTSYQNACHHAREKAAAVGPRIPGKGDEA